MKKYLLMVALAAYFSPVQSQNTILKTEKDVVKNIEVTGVAEMEVVPDELYFTISLKEYFKDEKSQKDKVAIEVLEKQLIEAVKAAGLPRENLSISGVTGYREWNGRKKPQIFLAAKQYQLKLSNLNNVNDLMAKVDDRGIEYVSMSRVEHSKKEEFRKQVKINALKAAKDKASYLLESIGEKVGEVLEIREGEDNYYYPQLAQQRNFKVMAMSAEDAPQEPSLEFQKIKISYRMVAVFRIK
jgi:uncharacterized protein